MKTSPTFLLLLVFPFFLIAQHNEPCDFVSNYSEETWEVLQSPRTTKTFNEVELPIVIHQFSNYSENQVRGIVGQLNNFFNLNETGISFSLCSFIDYDEDLEASRGEIRELSLLHNDPHAVNIYVLKQAGSNGALASFISNGQGWIGLSRFDAGAVGHEMGHYLSLSHTHQWTVPAELVDGSNCEEAGDRHCDTPADPDLHTKVNNNCEYIGTEVDENGDSYDPDTKNLMSYSLSFCRDYFSPEQIEQMQNSIELYYSDYACLTSSTTTPSLADQVAIFPNPTTGIVNLQIPANLSTNELNVKLYNHLGQELMVRKNLDLNEIDCSNLESGLYYLQIYLEKQSIQKQVIRL